MRPNLFGANMARKIAHGLGRHMLVCYLTRPIAGARNPAALTAGTTVGASSQSWTCRGMAELYSDHEIEGFRFRGSMLDGTLTRASMRRVTILGGSLPDDVDPQPNDVITIEGAAWRIDGALGGVERDPAGAVFTCHCSGTNVPSVSTGQFTVSAQSVLAIVS